MCKKILVILVFFVSFHVYSMEIEYQDTSFFSRLPRDLQDVIALLLMPYDEDDKGFFKRTIDYNYATFVSYASNNNLLYDCMVYCPDKANTVFVDYRSSRQEVEAVIVGPIKDQKITINYGEDLPDCFALSQQGTFFAAAIERSYTQIPKNWTRYIRNITVDNFGTRYYHFNVMKIINLVNNKTRTFPVEIGSLNALAYNKQGDQLIIHGSQKEHKIIPLKRSIKIAPESDKKNGLLNYYFREKRICKTITSNDFGKL